MTVIIVSIGFTLVVLVLSIVTITKGYAFKHSVDPIDPLPEEIDENEKINKNNI